MTNQTLEIPIAGMDCAECTQQVQQAIEKLHGVQSVNVFLATEKAIVKLDPSKVDLTAIRAAVQGAGYDVPASTAPQTAPTSMEHFNRQLTILLVSVFAIILSIVIFGEGLGWFDFLNERVPFLLGLAIVIAGGYPVFVNVIRATLKRQII
jgi:Cd2+/Zn2+-exporting ATPase/Cu+-exporting ATPase